MTTLQDLLVPPLLIMLGFIALPAAVLAYIIAAVLLASNKWK